VTNYDCTTIKYYSNGDTAWVRRYNGPADSSDKATALAVDSSGNVYVAGYSWCSGTFYDYVTIKYYPNGDTAWVTTYNGDADSMDVADNITVDNRGVRFDWEDAVDPNPFDQLEYDLHVSTSYGFHPDSTTIDSDLVASECVKTLDYGTYYWKVKVKDNWGAERWSNQIRYFMVTGIHASLGDFDGNGSIDVADVVFLINYLYTSGPAPDPLELGDVNCDNEVNIGDVMFLINFLFKNGHSPSC
jgi:hypothetical protein